MIRSTLSSILLLLAACSPAADRQSTVNQSEPVAAEEEATAVPSLEGRWSVAEINDAPLRQPFPIDVRVGENRLTMQSDCVNLGWVYTQNRNIVSFSRVPVESCGRGLTVDEEQAERVITLANIAIFSEDGKKVKLSGPGGRLTLTRR